MDLQQLKYFQTLAEKLHFWNTATEVDIPQSSLSRYIKNLESELRIKLFERGNKHNVKLTPAGDFLKNEFDRILEDFKNVIERAREMHAGEDGTIRIGHPTSVTFSVLPEILSKVSQKHPKIHVKMSELDLSDVDSSLLTHRIDIAFSRDPPKSKELESKLLLTENFALVVSANNPISKKNKVNLSKLNKERFVLPSLTDKSEHASLLREIFDKAGFEPKVSFESEFGVTLLGLVAKDLGISVMPFSYSQYLTDEVKFIKISETSNLYVVWRGKDKNSVLKNFLNVTDCFSKYYFSNSNTLE